MIVFIPTFPTPTMGRTLRNLFPSRAIPLVTEKDVLSTSPGRNKAPRGRELGEGDGNRQRQRQRCLERTQWCRLERTRCLERTWCQRFHSFGTPIIKGLKPWLTLIMKGLKPWLTEWIKEASSADSVNESILCSSRASALETYTRILWSHGQYGVWFEIFIITYWLCYYLLLLLRVYSEYFHP